MKIRIELSEGASLPKKAHLTDAGHDLTALSVDVKSDIYVEYDTGVKIDVPVGYVALIFPRSSVSGRGMTLANSVGVIDPAYRGTIKVRFYAPYKQLIYSPGERVAQLTVIKTEDLDFNVVQSIEDTERGIGGFGSSGS